jgi:hypothetical protein
MLQQSVNAQVVQERQEHSSIAIARDVHAHVDPNMQAAAATSRILY